ncbi:outer membrane beta-barrel protein [Simonsiella muelleri]|uniref:outer membrane beta-barrel protein n=1 Tax=Simonsiella muelleri TaxID=72 RepID=UPI0028D74E36|nr:outer membrane beta-barrel protein [Simonsiella muelleri]
MKKLLTILLATTVLTAHAENVSGEVSLTPVKPYVFGTVGTAQDGLKTLDGNFNSRDERVAGQIGFGLQLNDYMGGEVYYQGGDKFEYKGKNGNMERVRVNSVGTRATIGTSTQNRGRVFAKLGVVAVDHETSGGIDSNARPQFTAGVGASYNINNNFAVRSDYDHVFKRNTSVDRKGADYVGVGGQVNF